MSKIFLFGNSHVSNYAAAATNWTEPETLKWRTFGFESTEPFYGNISVNQITYSWLIPSSAFLIKDAGFKLDQKGNPFKVKNEILDNMSKKFEIWTGDKLIAHWGDQDILRHLPKYKNQSSLVQEYVESVKDFFGQNVIFLEPTPPATKEWKFKVESYEFLFEHKDILDSYAQFVKVLRDSADTIPICDNIIEGSVLTAQDTDDGAHLNRNASNKLIEHISSLYLS